MPLHIEYAMHACTFFDFVQSFSHLFLVFEAVDLDSLFLHHFDFNLLIIFYVHCTFISESYDKTFTLTLCFYATL